MTTLASTGPFSFKLDEWNESEKGFCFYPSIEQCMVGFYRCKFENLEVIKLKVNPEDLEEFNPSSGRCVASKIFVEKIIPKEEYQDLLEFYI